MKLFLGIDVGSVSTNIVVMDHEGQLVDKIYVRSQGNPVGSVQQALVKMLRSLKGHEIAGVGTTGSGRQLIGAMLGADLVKNEITAHAVACLNLLPEVHTIIEIGGQDSKLIIIENGIVHDFAMNTVCAAGTGSFLDQQAARLNMEIGELGQRAAAGEHPVRIAGRCAVFAESDMIHKQQMGHRIEDILAGLCQALVRNFLANLGKGRQLKPPFIFQGGVAANLGICRAFEIVLGAPLLIPEHYEVMGALGVALLVRDKMLNSHQPSAFKGMEIAKLPIVTSSFDCNGCANQCEVIRMKQFGELLACLGDKCGKWSQQMASYDGDQIEEPQLQTVN